MYAVIETGGKQYRVTVGDNLKVEKLDAEEGSILELGRVLMISGADGPSIGSPLVENASVSAKVLAHGRGDKVKVFKLKRRKNYRLTQGHRQDYTEIEITAISGNGSEVPEADNGEPGEISREPAVGNEAAQ